jgi:ABC-type antimicrobial peptide transport system permease subunit
VGVVDDVRYGGLDRPTGGAMYTPYAQTPNPGMYLVVRTVGSPWSASRQLRDAVHAIDPRVPVGQPRTLRQLRHASVAQPESRAILVGCLAALALVLASVGLYGNSAYATSQRTFEVGLRMALGADARSVFTMLMRGGLVPVVVGLVIGLGAAAGLSRVVASLLFGVRPLDHLTFATVPALFLVVAASAISLPALRAARVDPATTLRQTR